LWITKYKHITQIVSPSSSQLFRAQPVIKVQGLDGQMWSCSINKNNIWSLYGAGKIWLVYSSGSIPYCFLI